MSLTTCLRKAGSAINAEDKAAILKAAAAYRKSGLKADDAARKAVDERIAAVQGMMAEREQALANPAPEPVVEATHAEPGEAPESVTKAVVTEAVKTAAENRNRKPSEMRAELLAMIDAKLPNAPDEYLPTWKAPTKERIRNAMVSSGLTNEASVVQMLEQEHENRVAEAADRIGYVTFKVPGDGTFRVLNTKSKLEDFRKRVAASPGFKAPAGMPKPEGAAGGERGYGGAAGAITGMIDEGDPQAAVDYAAARGLDIAEVLKGDKPRLGKIAGLEPTGEAVGEFEPEASLPDLIAAYKSAKAKERALADAKNVNLSELARAVETKTDDAGNVAMFSRSRGSGVPMADARAVAGNIRAALPKAPPIILHESVDAAPKSLRDIIYDQRAENDVEAAYHEGEIHVFPQHIESIERMEFVVARHEIRHYGIRAMLGPRYGQMLMGMAKQNPALRDAARRKMDAGLADSLVHGVDEALADMPVEQLERLTGFDRFVSALRQWLRDLAARLRKAGHSRMADMVEPSGWTDKDVAAFVLKAEDVSRGVEYEPQSVGGTMFQRRDDMAVPEIGTGVTDEGYPEFAGRDVTLAFPQPAERFEVIPDPGQEVVSYAIMPASGFDVLGHVELLVENGRPVSLLDIEVYADKGRGQGVGRAVIETLLAANPTADLNISNIVPEARGFWERMGIPQQNVEGAYDGNLNWQAFAAANRGAARGDAQGRRGAREGRFDQGQDAVEGAARQGEVGSTRFSRAADAGKIAAQDLLNSKGGVFDFNRLGETKQDRVRTVIDGSRPFWLGALTRDQIADIYGDEITPVRDYDTLTRNMENERQKRAQDADKLYTEWSGLDQEASDALGRVMLDATVFQVHPDKQSPPADADAKARMVHTRIRREYEALPAEAQTMYGKVRDFHQATLNDLKAAVEARINRQVENGQAKQAALTNIRKMFDQYLKGGPYFPLSRFGDFLVVADRESDGERVVAAYETAGEQQAAARALQADGFKVKLKTSKTYSRQTDGSAGKFIGDVMASIEKVDMVEATVNGSRSDLKNQLLDDLNQMFIRSLPDLSYRKHFMHRKNTPGFSADVMRGFASSAFHAASHIARLNHGDRMTFALSDAYQAIEQAPEGDFNKHMQVLNELSKRHDASLNPNTHPIAAMLNQVGFVMYLGLSPAAGLVNLLQTPMVTLPHLGARYGFGKASASLGKATKDIMAAPMNKSSGWDATASDKLTKAEKEAMRELQDEGIVDLTQAHDLAAASGLDTGNVARSKAAFAMARAMKIVGWTFHVPEVMNRQATALSAYRLEMEASGNSEKAKDAAREAIKRTHFDYSSSNRARYMQGNVARVVMQFKQYAQNMTYLLGRAAQQALNGESPEVRRIARRQLVATLGSTFAMAGTLGLPALGAVMGAIGTMVDWMDDDDEPWDWKVEFRNLMADQFGKEVGEVMAHGLPRALMPWDVSGRVGMGDLWFRSSDREGQNPREAFATDVGNILGPTAGTLLGWYTAADHMQRGDYSKAVEAVVPKFIRDPLKAARESTDGMTSYTGEPLRDVTAAEAIGRALGFAPAAGSEMYEGRNAVMNAKTAIEERRQRLLTKIVKAKMDGDTEREAELRAEIDAFNRRNPEQKITGATIMRSIRNRRRNRENTVDGIMLPDTKDYLRERGRFAVVE